jgi:hypothetical protein
VLLRAVTRVLGDVSQGELLTLVNFEGVRNG